MAEDGTILPPTSDTIGFEPTWEGYLDHVVRRDLRALKPVMRPDGVMFVVLDDTIAAKPSVYGQQQYHAARSKMKLSSQISLRTQDTTYLAPEGNWLGLPTMFAKAMVADGWYWRDTIIWDKGTTGRKESTELQVPAQLRDSPDVRPESFFRVLVKSGPAAHPALRWKTYSVTAGSVKRPQQAGRAAERLTDRDFRVASNPLGPFSDAVWRIPQVGRRDLILPLSPKNLSAVVFCWVHLPATYHQWRP